MNGPGRSQSVWYLAGLILASVLVLALFWEFIAEPFIDQILLDQETESFEERWKFVITAVVFTAIGLIGPMRIIKESWGREDASGMALTQTEARLRTFLDTTSDWTWEIDRQFRFTSMAGRCGQITRRDPDWYLGKTFKEAFEAPREEVAALVARLVRGAPFRDLTLSDHLPDGTPVYLSWNGNPILDRKGRFLGYRGNGRDVTAEVKARQEADVLRNQLVDAVEALDEGFALYDADDRLVLCNSRYREIYALCEPAMEQGATFEEIVRYGAERGQYQEAEGRVDDFVRERVALHRDPSGPIEQPLGDGRWLRIVERRTRDGGVVGIRSDITRLKQAEQRLLDAIESVPEAFVLWDAEDRLVLCNERYRSYFSAVADIVEPGVEYETLLRRAVAAGQFKIPDGGEEAWIEERLASHARQEGSREIHLADGRWFLAADRRTADGGTVGVRSDITESVQANEILANRSFQLATSLEELDANAKELERFARELEVERDNANAANLAKSQFLSNMSHELRTPLNAIMGFSEIMHMNMFGPLGARQYQDYATSIHDSAKHLLELISDILDVSKIEAGKYELHREGILIADVIEEAIRLVGPRAQEGGLKIVTDLPRPLPAVYVDRRAIKQVLVNLLSNAVKFTPRDGTVSVVARAEAGWLSVDVTDTGIGIPGEQMERIFQPFVQVERERGRYHEGTGLGLSLSKALIEMHDGRIEAESAAGEGTTVRIILPAADKIVWLPTFSVGNPHLDGDHRAIFRMIDDLAGDLRAGRVNGEFLPAFGRLIDHIQVHFRKEEDLMKAIDYPDFEAHCAHHRNFLAWAENVRQAPGEGESLAVIDHLVDWWFSHVMRTDNGYRPWFEERPETVEAILAESDPLPASWLPPVRQKDDEPA